MEYHQCQQSASTAIKTGHISVQASKSRGIDGVLDMLVQSCGGRSGGQGAFEANLRRRRIGRHQAESARPEK